jgi:hypothetical protein
VPSGSDETGIRCAYRIEFQEPVWSWVVEVDKDFFIGQAKLFQGDMHTVAPSAAVVRVHLDLWVLVILFGHGGRHDGPMRLS